MTLETFLESIKSKKLFDIKSAIQEANKFTKCAD